MAEEDCFGLVKLGVLTPNKIKKEEVVFGKEERTISNDTTISQFGEENEGLPSKKPRVSAGPTPDVTLSASGDIVTSTDVPINVEVVGLHDGRCGRSYRQHAICGLLVEKGHILQIFFIPRLMVDGKCQKALACHAVKDGVVGCRVGFLRRWTVAHKEDYDGRCIKIVALHEHNPDPAVRRSSYKNCGSAKAIFID